MRTKFIEGFNGKYSIREDGVFIRHYHSTRMNSNIFYKDRELPSRASNSIEVWLEGKKYRINMLLFKYFNTCCCANCKKFYRAESRATSICSDCMDQKKNNIVYNIDENTRKFIKGTNNQYSIGIDGTVIRHFYMANSNTIVVKDDLIEGYLAKNVLRVELSVNKKCVARTVGKLVANHFDLINPFLNNNSTQVKIINVDGNPRNCSKDNLKWVIKDNIPVFTSLEERYKYHSDNRDLYSRSELGKLARKRYQNRARSTPEGLARLRAKSLKKAREYQETLHKVYIANTLKIPISLLTDELYQSHKALLSIKRLLSQKENISVYSFNNLKL